MKPGEVAPAPELARPGALDLGVEGRRPTKGSPRAGPVAEGADKIQAFGRRTCPAGVLIQSQSTLR
jgi:hypothetical protein